MCGEPWSGDKCGACGWSERLDHVNRQRLDVGLANAPLKPTVKDFANLAKTHAKKVKRRG